MVWPCHECLLEYSCIAAGKSEICGVLGEVVCNSHARRVTPTGLWQDAAGGVYVFQWISREYQRTPDTADQCRRLLPSTAANQRQSEGKLVLQAPMVLLGVQKATHQRKPEVPLALKHCFLRQLLGNTPLTLGVGQSSRTRLVQTLEHTRAMVWMQPLFSWWVSASPRMWKTDRWVSLFQERGQAIHCQIGRL